jgi:hypothetical protein
MSRTIDRWRRNKPGLHKHGQQENLPERQYPIVPPALPSSLRLRSLILDEDLTVAGDITTAPDSSSSLPSDGLPPTASPTPTVAGGPRWLAVQWATQSNVDSVTYDVYVGTAPGFTPGPTNLASSTPGNLIFIYSVNAVPLAYGTNYYTKIIARDVDGSAPVGGEVGPSTLDPNRSPDIFAGAITADKLAAVMVLTSSLIAGTSNAQRVEVGYGSNGAGAIDSNFIGIRAFRSDGTTVTFSVDAASGDVYVKGIIDWGTGSTLTSDDIMEIKDQSTAGGFQSGNVAYAVQTKAAATNSVAWNFGTPSTTGQLVLIGCPCLEVRRPLHGYC